MGSLRGQPLYIPPLIRKGPMPFISPPLIRRGGGSMGIAPCLHPFLLGGEGGVVWGPYGDNPFISPPHPFISPPLIRKGGVVWGEDKGLCPRFRAEWAPAHTTPPLLIRGGDIKGIGPFLIRGGVVWGPMKTGLGPKGP